MVDKNMMAAFGEGFVQTQVISENNAVKYKLSIAGSQRNSVPNSTYCMLNDNPLGSQVFTRGITVRVINTTSSSVVDTKTFDVGYVSGGATTAFLNYMAGLAPGLLVCILTSVEINSDEQVDAWFKSANSYVWPGTGMCKMFPTSCYAAFYLTTEKTIAMEHVVMNDGVLKEDSRAILEVVYDTIGDIGATGFPRKAIYDMSTYTGTTSDDYVRYPDSSALISPLTTYGLKAGDFIFSSFDLYADKPLLDTGSTVRCSIRWFKGTTLISSNNSEVSTRNAGYWTRFERYLTIPATADGFSVLVQRYPGGTTGGTGSVKNMLMTRVSRFVNDVTRSAEFGVNGIRMNTAIEDSSYILELPDTQVDPSGNIYAGEFREFEKSY